MNLDNVIMWWDDDTTGATQPPLPASPSRVKVSDHNRSPLSVSVERIEQKNRMANGRLRKYVVANKRTWSCSWENFPSKSGFGGSTVDDGLSGYEMKDFHDDHPGEFWMFLRDGDETETAVKVMFSEFSHEVVRRGPEIDFWSVTVSLEEV